MSNRRRPQRRDAHGAPVRTRQEVWIAIATGVSVLLVTVLLIVWLQHEPAGPPAVAPTPTSQAKPTGSTSSTVATPSSSTASTTASSAASSTTTTAPAASTTSTTKP